MMFNHARVCFVFPGQGSQHKSMMKTFYDHFEVSRSVLHQSSDVLDIDMKSLFFDDNGSSLEVTENAQPALLTASFMAIRALEDVFETPIHEASCMAGHSLGEYTALCAAGSLSFEQALNIVRLRGIAMRDASRETGAMMAVLGLTCDAIEEVVQSVEGCFIANDNCPGQIVISGLKTSLDAAALKLMERGARRVIPLKVSGAFHTPLMENARFVMKPILEKLSLSALKCQVISNVTARPFTEIPSLLIDQITRPVRWRESMKFIEESSNVPPLFIEVGPGHVLSQLNKKSIPAATHVSLNSIQDLNQLKDLLKSQAA